MMIVLFVFACLNPIPGCATWEEGYDCCETDEQCAEFYADEDFPYCLNPGVRGVCSECTLDQHCPAGMVCDVAALGGVCLE